MTGVCVCVCVCVCVLCVWACVCVCLWACVCVLWIRIISLWCLWAVGSIACFLKPYLAWFICQLHVLRLLFYSCLCVNVYVLVFVLKDRNVISLYDQSVYWRDWKRATFPANHRIPKQGKTWHAWHTYSCIQARPCFPVLFFVFVLFCPASIAIAVSLSACKKKSHWHCSSANVNVNTRQCSKVSAILD